uniref:TRAP transporter small permease n=1 Tax=candidate division WOR-3 bacterium TaxID=2052148 RepID=A0A7C2K6E4_UNCW3
MGKINRVWGKFITIQMIIGTALILFDVVIVNFSIFARYVFNYTQVELFEITEYTLLWMTFLGTTWLLKNKGHVTVELIVSRVSPKRREKLMLIVNGISALLMVILFIFSLKVFIYDFKTNYRLAGVLRPPKWPIEIIIPIGIFFMLLEIVRQLYEGIAEIKLKK